MINNSLIGDWRGNFSFAELDDTFASFRVIFAQAANAISGTMSEKIDHTEFPSHEYDSDEVAVQVTGRNVTFTAAREDFRTFVHEGTLSEDGLTITGIWRVFNSDKIQGHFTLRRATDKIHPPGLTRSVEAQRECALV